MPFVTVLYHIVAKLTKMDWKPRSETIVLENDFQKPGQYSPATWEGCVVKLSDKIAYVGRDIEDAIQLGFIDEESKNTLRKWHKRTIKMQSIQL